jgi:hypothetical protein
MLFGQPQPRQYFVVMNYNAKHTLKNFVFCGGPKNDCTEKLPRRCE